MSPLATSSIAACCCDDVDMALKHLQSELFCVEWDLKPQLNQSVNWSISV